jgi:hypothetical protein
MSRHKAFWMGLVLLPAQAGCVYIPTWDWPEPECCQCAEDRWGDLVDHINHQSSIDQPWHDPEYCKRGVYRVAAPGTVVIEPSGPNDPPVLIPPPSPVIERTGYLKPF